MDEPLVKGLNKKSSSAPECSSSIRSVNFVRNTPLDEGSGSQISLIDLTMTLKAA
jgi:hypothetical protein